MAEEKGGLVFDAEGLRGQIEGPAPGGGGGALVLLPDGRRLVLPSGALAGRGDGTLFFRGSFEELAGDAREGAAGGDRQKGVGRRRVDSPPPHPFLRAASSGVCVRS